jgi:hypothetical protein
MGTFLESALTYAQGRWCWDDTEFLREQYEDLNTPLPGENPVKWINRLAEQYGCIDPKDTSFVHPSWANLNPVPETPLNRFPPGTVVTVRDDAGEIICSWTVEGGLTLGPIPRNQLLDELCVTLTAD